MEFIEGQTLSEYVAAHGRLSATEAMAVGDAVCRALAAVHDAGLVHRDVKPSNIIFVNHAPKLADIGLVAAIDDPPSNVGTSGFVPR